MKKILLPIILITLILLPSEVMSNNKFNFIKSTTKGTSLKLPNEKNIQQYKTLYLDKAQNQSNSGDNLQACLTIRKLVDLLLKKTNETNVDEWLASYGRFYKEVTETQNQYKKKFIDKRNSSIKKEYDNIKRDRLSVKTFPKVKDIKEVKDDYISFDNLLSISAINDPYSDNLHIGIYLFDKKEKLFEELPIPNDEKNPQIKRWSRKYIIKSPKWSPTGDNYAYLLNGALCISSQINKPILISEIKDTDKSNDISFDWSMDGKNICYLRKTGNEVTAFINNIYSKKEKKIGKAENISISSDGKFAVIENNGKISLYNSQTNKLTDFANGKYPTFSTDDNSIIYVSNNFSINSKQINDKKDKILFKGKKDKNIISVSGISKNIIAVVFSDGNLVLLANDEKTLQVTNKAGKIEKSFPNSTNGILCENKYVKFN